MREWRVGTVSMGLSLIMLGIFLFLSLLNGYEVFQTFLAWWPLILIVLGLEITIYTLLPKNKEALLKYDFISILFVGLIGTIAIGLTFLTSTGIIERIKYQMTAEIATIEFEKTDIEVSDDIKRVVLRGKGEDVRIEGTNSDVISLFGTYSTEVVEGKSMSLSSEDYILTEISGDTLFVYLKEPTRNGGLFESYTDTDITIAVPSQVAIEVVGHFSVVSLNPGFIQRNWVIRDAHQIDVSLNKKNNVQVSASTHHFEGNVQ
jgi:hypothetical protein